MIKTKCIKAPAELSDGTRISVMSMHTLNDGITPDDSIKPEMYDLHITDLAPPKKLLGDYYKRDLSWDEYEIRYLAHIRQPYIQKIIKHILTQYDDITFLCIEPTDDYCHRRLLKLECMNIQIDK